MTASVRALGFLATYKVIDRSTVVVTEPEGDETVFGYVLEGDAIRLSFKNADPQRMCKGDTKCPLGFIVWESAAVQPGLVVTVLLGQAESRAAGACVTDHTLASRPARSPRTLIEPT